MIFGVMLRWLVLGIAVTLVVGEETTTTAAGSTTSSGPGHKVVFTMNLLNVNYESLMANSAVMNRLTSALETAIASESGPSTGAGNVVLEFSARASGVSVVCIIHPPYDVWAGQVIMEMSDPQVLIHAIYIRLQEVQGIAAVLTGEMGAQLTSLPRTMTVETKTSTTTTTITHTASTTSRQPGGWIDPVSAGGEEEGDSDMAMIAAIMSGCCVAATCLGIFAACFMWKCSRLYRRMFPKKNEDEMKSEFCIEDGNNQPGPRISFGKVDSFGPDGEIGVKHTLPKGRTYDLRSSDNRMNSLEGSSPAASPRVDTSPRDVLTTSASRRGQSNNFEALVEEEEGEADGEENPNLDVEHADQQQVRLTMDVGMHESVDPMQGPEVVEI